MDAIDKLMELPLYARRRALSRLTQEERHVLSRQLEFRARFPWYSYLGDPVGFVNKGLGEITWSLQEDILRSIVENKRTAVPACHAPGKTHIAARAAAYFVSVHPPGTARVVTTSMDFKKVRVLLWPHIRRLHKLHHLIGDTTETEWKLDGEYMAEGVKPPDDADGGISGYHAPHLLIIVDEAGGIKRKFGESIEALMTGTDTHMLVLGNPPVSGDASWFETICGSPLYNTIPIPYTATPNFTGEDAGLCASCPPEVRPHPVKEHLIDVDWVENLRNEYGEDSAWFQARAMARFVHESATKTIPMESIQAGMSREDAGPGPIKLGADIAADGGDEFVIARLDGWTLGIAHHSQGEANANAPMVAAKILEHIRVAEKDHEERGIRERVQVKLDSIGVGWGVAGILQQWQREGKFKANIVAVNVAEKARDSKKFYNQRAEMWWNGRTLLEPNNPAGGLLKLDITAREAVQLNGPMYGADSSARTTIEKKKDMGKRGLHSPDRAEAMLLALYEPPNDHGKNVGAVNLGQTNTWGSV
jgi:hypothetical protein